MTLILDTLAQHPYAAYSLFVAGLLFGFVVMLRVLDARAVRQINEGLAAAQLRAAVHTGSVSDVPPWREQVRLDVQRYRATQRVH